LEEKSENGALFSFKDVYMNINKERGFFDLFMNMPLLIAPMFFNVFYLAIGTHVRPFQSLIVRKFQFNIKQHV
jgi:hypothetical protein